MCSQFLGHHIWIKGFSYFDFPLMPRPLPYLQQCNWQIEYHLHVLKILHLLHICRWNPSPTSPESHNPWHSLKPQPIPFFCSTKCIMLLVIPKGSSLNGLSSVRLPLKHDPIPTHAALPMPFGNFKQFMHQLWHRVNKLKVNPSHSNLASCWSSCECVGCLHCNFP